MLSNSLQSPYLDSSMFIHESQSFILNAYLFFHFAKSVTLKLFTSLIFITINLLQFVDDTLFVFGANTQNILVIKSVFRCF